MLDMALKPTYGKGRDLEGAMARMRKEYPHTISWLDSLQTHEALKDTFIHTENGRRLHAFYVRAPKVTAKTAILLHGYTDKAIRMLPIGYIYHQTLEQTSLQDFWNKDQAGGAWHFDGRFHDDGFSR